MASSLGRTFSSNVHLAVGLRPLYTPCDCTQDWLSGARSIRPSGSTQAALASTGHCPVAEACTCFSSRSQ
jgi:hypothetical protein